MLCSKPSCLAGTAALLIFALVSALNGFLFVASSSVVTFAQAYYTTSDVYVNLIGQGVFMGYLLGIPLYLKTYDTHGPRFALLVSAALNLLGAVLRLPRNIISVIIGTGLTGAAIPFYLGMPSALAATWFPPQERSRITAVAAMFNQFGLAMGFLVPPALITKGNISGGFEALNVGTVVVAVLSVCLTYKFFRDGPVNADGEQEDVIARKHGTLCEQLRLSVRTPRFMLIALSFAVTTSIYWTLAIVLDETLEREFSPLTIGYFGATLMAMGAGGMLASGFILNATKMYKRHIAGVIALALALLAVFTYLVQQKPSEDAMFAISAVTGFIMPASQPALLELAAVSCPMIDEYVGGTVLFFWVMLFAILFTAVSNSVIDNLNCLFYVFLALYAGVLLWFLMAAEDPSDDNLAAADHTADSSRCCAGEGAALLHYDNVRDEEKCTPRNERSKSVGCCR